MCSSPLLVDDKLIVNPGAKDASLVALDRLNGKLLWRTPGAPVAYASFVLGRFGGKRQIVGYDSLSLGGWDPETGKRLWILVPPSSGDFNVPTPIALEGKLLVATENNGTRLYDFDREGKIIPQPLATFADLAPDSSSPVVVNGRVFGCRGELFCLEAADLKHLWSGMDKAFGEHVSLIGSRDRILIISARGELLLVSAGGKQFELISRLQIFDERSEVLSHPALVGNRLYLRDSTSVCCVLLDDKE
jgi:outer membrane protein assembly factor BamB